LIYNWTAWLRNQFTTETFYSNERKAIAGATIPDRCILSIEGAGDDKPPMNTGFTMVQVTVRAKNNPEARTLAWSIYKYAVGRWGQILPAVSIGGVSFPALTTGQITANGRPASLGEDVEGRTEFVMNLQIYWRR